MRRSRLYQFAFVVGLLFACSEERITGNTTQTENTVSARTILVDSVLPAWNHPYWIPTVAILRLDSSNFDFSKSDSAGRDLEVTTEAGDSIPFDVIAWDKPARQGRLQVRLEKNLLAHGAKFVLRWSQPLKVRSDRSSVWRDIPDSQRLHINSVLVDDFERQTLRSRLPDSASWYRAASDDSVKTSDPVLVGAGSGRTGTALHFVYQTPPNTYKYALIGIALGSRGKPCNLRSMDSLVFWVRGSGRLSVAFDRLPPYSPGKAWLHKNLDVAWTRLCIKPDSLLQPDGIGENIGWNAVRDQVTNLTFLVSGGTDLYLDEVRMYGVDFEDLK